ncbi:hypothetical protein RSO41_13050 [Halomonas sp. I1]|uniref:hypothetical protein n=1 Tax=Halomonas sp. I1 TaxID=393536 RepID=UPI0028DE5991|nr:hypothetical protein [Halomonas sp. I1]MDT8895582.1 hypothetical protein [Halomonas sp. I1]
MSRTRRRTGATRRHAPSRRLRCDWGRFDRWLDRVVTLAVITALLVGGAALILNLTL